MTPYLKNNEIISLHFFFFISFHSSFSTTVFISFFHFFFAIFHTLLLVLFAAHPLSCHLTTGQNRIEKIRLSFRLKNELSSLPRFLSILNTDTLISRAHTAQIYLVSVHTSHRNMCVSCAESPNFKAFTTYSPLCVCMFFFLQLKQHRHTLLQAAYKSMKLFALSVFKIVKLKCHIQKGVGFRWPSRGAEAEMFDDSRQATTRNG